MTAKGDSTPERTCKGCQNTFPATTDYFPPHAMGKYGLYTHCKPCKKIADANLRNRTDQKARQKAWRDANKEKIKAYNDAYRLAGYKSTSHVKAWVAANPDRARALVDKTVATRKTKPWYVLKTRISARLRMVLAGAGGKAKQSTEKILGYSAKELADHLERQFTKGMTWEKFLAGEIHIDHIIPVASFKAESTDSAEFRACWALANLRPLWAADNLAKSDKITHLI